MQWDDVYPEIARMSQLAAVTLELSLDIYNSIFTEACVVLYGKNISCLTADTTGWLLLK